MVFGKAGYVAWLYGIIYNRIRESCKNIYLKILVHSIGVLAMVVGLFYLITTMPSMLSIFGMILGFVGLIVFFIPIGIDTSG